MATSPIEILRPQLAELFRVRWRVADWRVFYPWWLTPPTCRILMYTDSSVRLSGGPFQGLTYVKTLLETQAYPYVQFKVDVCNRDGLDPSATIHAGTPKKLTDLDIMNAYDEIWFFGLTSGNGNLTAAEITLMNQFMDKPKYGGVLTTGDHADLGAGLCKQIKRVGQMRLYPAPPSSSPSWNTTLVQRPPIVGQPPDPPSAGQPLNFDDQSDDLPQVIRWRRYWAGPFHSRPHPVLCGPKGPIDFLPDHQHEGEALAPPVAGDPNWPTGISGQEAAEVIAWGKIKDPTATKYGQEIGVISAYNGHMVEVGRILADATWHHWFDINLLGVLGASPPYDGFDATAGGLAALKEIDGYFLNCGVWLAPPAIQSAMRNHAWWSTIWTDAVLELPAGASLRYFGKVGIDVLGRRAPRCAVAEWIWPREPLYKPKIPWWEWRMLPEELAIIDIPIEQYLAGGILRELALTYGHQSGKRSIGDKPPAAAELERTIAKGADQGLAGLQEDLQREHGLVGRLLEQRLNPKGLVPRPG